MRLAILTDIHSNLPALEAVLEATAESAPDETWCLGDVVGYGAQPDECAALVAERCQLGLVGNRLHGPGPTAHRRRSSTCAG